MKKALPPPPKKKLSPPAAKQTLKKVSPPPDESISSPVSAAGAGLAKPSLIKPKLSPPATGKVPQIKAAWSGVDKGKAEMKKTGTGGIKYTTLLPPTTPRATSENPLLLHAATKLHMDFLNEDFACKYF